MVPPIPCNNSTLRLSTLPAPQQPTPKSTPHSNPHPPLSPLHIALLDLPDEALAHIITAISPNGAVRRHDIEFGPESCDLAVTCRRLLHLFRTRALTALDALYPESYTQNQPRAPDGLLTSHHLASLVRLAGTALRVLRLPFDHISPHPILEELTIRRIQLEELVYRNVPPVPEFVESQLFAHAVARLRKLTIHNPTTALKYISNASNLEQLELTGVRPHHIFQLGILLHRLSPTLRVLRVGFDASDPPQGGTDANRAAVALRCLNTLAEFVGMFLSANLSMLHTLDVSTEPSPAVCHDPQADDQESELHPIAHDFERKVDLMREMNVSPSASVGLRHLTLRCTTPPLIANTLKCIDSFNKLISPNVTVELQTISFTVVFPHDGTLPYFRALQMTYEEVQVFDNDVDFDYTRMETLDIGSTKFVALYSGDEDIRRTVMDIVWQAEDVLSTLIMDAEVMTSVMMRYVCSYIGDVLEIAPNVETVRVRAEVVDFVDKGCVEFQRMMKMMRNVKVLWLSTQHQKAGDCKLAFGRRFPLFLNAVARSCPNLECLFLEPAPPVRPQSIASPEIFQLAIQSHELCTEAVENLEEMLPKCDVTSVRSQLNVWHRDLSALYGLLNRGASTSGEAGSGGTH